MFGEKGRTDSPTLPGGRRELKGTRGVADSLQSPSHRLLWRSCTRKKGRSAAPSLLRGREGQGEAESWGKEASS